MRLSSYTKTVFAPEEIHCEIIKLLYTIKKHFKKLIVLDETGFWDEYVDSFKKSADNLKLSLPELNETQIQELKDGFIKESDLDCIDEWFWKSNKSYEELNFPTIRDLLRKDLSRNRTKLITISEMIEISGDVAMGNLISNNSSELALIVLVEAWVKSATVNNITPIKRSILGWLISYGCFGFHGGYLNSFHRKAEKLFDKLIKETEDTQNPKVTLQVFYALLDYFKIMRI